jgi:hypothetical protein
LIAIDRLQMPDQRCCKRGKSAVITPAKAANGSIAQSH